MRAFLNPGAAVVWISRRRIVVVYVASPINMYDTPMTVVE